MLPPRAVFERWRPQGEIRHRDDWLEDRALGYNRRFLVRCNKLQTVCEQSATVFTARRGVQQFVNRVQQIATFAATKVAPRQPKAR